MKSGGQEVVVLFTHAQSKPNRNEEKSVIKKCKETVWVFLRTTTFPGVTQISSSPSALGKLLWFIMILFGAAFTVQQSYSSIMQYFKYEVVEKTTRQFDLSPTFPSVTVCANALLNINQGNLSIEIWHRILNTTRYLPNRPKYYTAEKYRKATQLYLTALTTAEKIAVGFSYEDIFLSCKFGPFPCDDVVVTHSPNYGNCFSLKSPWNGEMVSLDNSHEGLEVILNAPWDIYGNSSPAQGPMVYIHQPNTAPSFQPQNIITLYPNKWTTIKLQRNEMRRMKAPYSSQCIDGEDEIRLNSYYYSDDTPYEYSWDACIRTCLQRESLVRCGCYMRYIPLPPQINSSNARRFCGDDTCKLLQEINNDVCKCPPRCNETVYSFQIDINDRMFTYGGLKEVARYYLLRHTKQCEKSELKNICGFTIFFGDSTVEIIQEEAALSWATVLGSIGGNLGLWIGISIMSFGEILDLLLRILYVIMCHFYWKFCSKRNARIMNTVS